MTQYYTVPQVAKILQIPEITVLGLLRGGKLTHIRLDPGFVRISAASVEEYLGGLETKEFKMYRIPEEFRYCSVGLRNVLKKYELFDSIEDAAKFTREDLLNIPKVGLKKVEEVENILRDYGLKLKEA